MSASSRPGHGRPSRAGRSRQILGQPLPRRFQGAWLRFESPVRVLRDIADWIDASFVVTPGEPPREADGDLARRLAESERERGRLETERASLVGQVIEARDVAGSGVLGERLGIALAEVGVSETGAANERFDPGVHRAVDRVEAPDPLLDGVIAEVERPGYRDRGRVLRRPEVIVYRR